MSFSIDLSKAIKRAKGNQEIVVKRVMLETFKRCIAKSPVYTGRFRANWIIGIGSPNTATTDALDKRIVGYRSGSTIAAMSASVDALPFNGQKIFLTNSLPYATRLEHGWSKQSPHGMVRITLAEITAKYGT